METIVGIDLGTTNSLVGIMRHGRPELVPNVHGSLLTPSVVGILPSGEVVVGRPAVDLRVTDPSSTAACFKRFMGTDRVLMLGKRRLSPPELSALVLGSLKRDSESLLGGPVRRAVISVPAYFNDHQRQATRVAGDLAGLEVLRIVNEPTAAALTYGFHDRHGDKKVLVVDLGGGTFDVTLMQVFEGNIEILATAGESMLGGEDFTTVLVAHVLESRGLQYEATELTAPLRVSRLRGECEAAKRRLGGEAAVDIRIPGADGLLAEDGPVLRVTAEEYARLCEGLLARLASPVSRVLADSRTGPGDIQEMVFVGGGLRMPLVRRFFEARLDRPGLATHDPDLAVGLGVAVQAGLAARDLSVQDMVVTDVCPFTLGVEVSRHVGRDMVDGYYLPLIHRNTTIPVSRVQELQTLQAGQTVVELEVYQGDGRKVKDNLHLGSLKVKGIPPGPAGVPVEVRFTYDVNGILEVEARVPATGRTCSAIFTQHVSGLSKEAVRKAVERMQALKHHPREDLPARALLLFGERVFGELPSFLQGQLDEALCSFEAALREGDRRAVEQARDLLLQTLSSLGHPFENGPADAAGDRHDERG